MTPVHCRVKHDPDNGMYGDCVRACIASILDLDAEAVPHVFHDHPGGEVAMKRMREWLADRGLSLFVAHFDGVHSMADILAMQAILNPDVHYMLFGATDGGDHVVVCRGDKVVHNPAWYPSPLGRPGANGFWSVMVLARA